MSLRWKLLRFGSALVMVSLGLFVGYSFYELFGEVVFNISSHLTRRSIDSTLELGGFNRLMNSWKFTGRPHAVIYFAVSSDEDAVYRLKHYSLRRLENFFTNHYQYPVVIFHDNHFPNWHMVDIKIRSSSPVFFQQVNASLLQDDLKVESAPVQNCLRNVHDHQWNLFHMAEVFDHPVFDNVDYLWKMDDDSMLFHATGYDLFSYMKSHKQLYGYTLVVTEKSQCSNDVKFLVEKFVKENKIKKSNLMQGVKENEAFHDSFEISNVKFWRQPTVKKFLKYAQNYSMKNDLNLSSAIVHTAALKLFTTAEELHAFKDIYYKHRHMCTRSLDYYYWFYFTDVCLRLTIVRIVGLALFLLVVRFRRRSLTVRRREEFELINSKMV